MATTAEPFALIVRGATVFDGSGAPGARADVGVRGDRIAAVQVDLRCSAAREFDAYGLALAPGFIDVHSHDDFAVLLQPDMPFKVLQGVTTDIVGNCGSGVVPFEAGLESFRRLHPDADQSRGMVSPSTWSASRRRSVRAVSLPTGGLSRQ